MDTSQVVELMREFLFQGLQIVSPALIASLIVAVIVGVLQAITSVQEQTLSFFPKLLALFFVFYYTGPWMLEKMITLMKEYLNSIPGMLG